MTSESFGRIRSLHALLNHALLKQSDFEKLVTREEYSDYQRTSQTLMCKNLDGYAAWTPLEVDEVVIERPPNMEKEDNHDTTLLLKRDECDSVWIYRTQTNGQWVYTREWMSSSNRINTARRNTFAAILATIDKFSWTHLDILELHPSIAYSVVVALLDKLNQTGLTKRYKPDSYTQYEVKLDIMIQYTESLGWHYEPRVSTNSPTHNVNKY